jgi:hypothetical protein
MVSEGTGSIVRHECWQWLWPPQLRYLVVHWSCQLWSCHLWLMWECSSRELWCLLGQRFWNCVLKGFSAVWYIARSSWVLLWPISDRSESCLSTSVWPSCFCRWFCLELSSWNECKRLQAGWTENQGLIGDGGCCFYTNSVACYGPGTVGTFPGVWSWPPCNIEVTNAWSYTSFSPYILMLSCLVKQRDNISFTWS